MLLKQPLNAQGITAYQYAIVRLVSGLVTGSYFLVLFLMNVLSFQMNDILFLLLAIFSFMLAFGFDRKIFSALSLTSSFLLIVTNPAQFLNLDLAAFIWIWSVWLLVPSGEPLSRKSINPKWLMPRHLIVFSWVLLLYFLGLSLVELLGRLPGVGLQIGSSLGLLLLFLLVFDRRWLKAKVSNGNAVVYFDGVCNLCNGFVDFMIQEDRQRFLKYAPLQGASARAQFSDLKSEQLSTVIVQAGELRLEKSEGVFYVLAALGGFWRIFTVARIFPKGFLNFIYDRVAANRYRLFGKQSSCRLPSPEERALFLD